jgi:hypothetical protein
LWKTDAHSTHLSLSPICNSLLITFHYPSTTQMTSSSKKHHASITTNSKIQVGSYKLTPGIDLLPLTDSTPLYTASNYPALFKQLDKDGVILVRGVISKEVVEKARRTVLDHLKGKGAIEQDANAVAKIKKTEGGERVKGWTIDADSGGVNGDRETDTAVEGWRKVGTSKEVLNVYHGPELHRFFHSLFTAGHQLQVEGSAPSSPFTAFPDCTWLRIRGHGDDTTEHTDYYYFKQERTIFSDHFLHSTSPSPAPSTCIVCSSAADPHLTLLCDLCDHPIHTYCHKPPLQSVPLGEYHCSSCANLPFPFYTAWIALGPVHQQHGRLALVEGSHRLQGYEEGTKGDGKLPREWKGKKAKTVWRSADMEGGDLLLFNMKTVHAASVNQSEEFRMSMDTRVTMAQGEAWKTRNMNEEEDVNG